MTTLSHLKALELEREKRMGGTNATGSDKHSKLNEHPVFEINQKSNQLLVSGRSKLKTIREKNAEELIKQGKRWERERLQLEEQERLKEISARHDREKMLEEQTLYIFDETKAQMSGIELLKLKNRKYTACEIDLKEFLLSEKENNKKRMQAQNSEDRLDGSKVDF